MQRFSTPSGVLYPGQPARVLRSPRSPAQRVGRGQLITLGMGLSLTRRRGWADRPRPLRTQCVRTRRAVAFVNGLVDIPGRGKDLPSTSAAIKSKQGCGAGSASHRGWEPAGSAACSVAAALKQVPSLPLHPSEPSSSRKMTKSFFPVAAKPAPPS